jgi:prepilin-type N-terminal cleavage/methylation domain-containing protein
LAKSHTSSSRARLAARDTAGFSLVEVMVATMILALALVNLAQLFGVSTRANVNSRGTTYAAVLAEQKLEELRALTWGFDDAGLPLTDSTTNTAVSPETPNGGTGLEPSPVNSLQENTPGYVDYIDGWGNKVGAGEKDPPNEAVYMRRWSITPLPTNPNNTLILQVLVTRNRVRGEADNGAVSRLPDEARITTVKTRKAR